MGFSRSPASLTVIARWASASRVSDAIKCLMRFQRTRDRHASDAGGFKQSRERMQGQTYKRSPGSKLLKRSSGLEGGSGRIAVKSSALSASMRRDRPQCELLSAAMLRSGDRNIAALPAGIQSTVNNDSR